MDRAPTLLNAFPMLRSHCVVDASKRMGRVFSPHRLELKGGSRGLNVQHNQVRLRDIAINILHYGADVSIDTTERSDFYMVQLPLVGQAQVACANEQRVADPATLSILPPRARNRMEWNGDCTMILVQVPSDALRRRAIQSADALNPRFALFRSRDDRNVAAWWQAVEDLVSNLDRFGDQWLRNPAAYIALEEFLLSTLAALLREPEAETDGNHGSLRCFQLAKAYVHDNLDRALSSEEIARHAGVHARTLEAIFKRQGETSPVAYARRCRLLAVHEKLQAAQRDNRDLSVTKTALDHGFIHMGRFAAQYREHFGCCPSDTYTGQRRDN